MIDCQGFRTVQYSTQKGGPTMRTQRMFVCAAEFLLFVGFACAAAVPALAGGNGKDANHAPAYRPAPVLEKKVFTNEDLETIARQYGGPSTVQPSPAATPSASAQSAPSQAGRILLPTEKDPGWYAQEAESLSAEADAIDARVQQLRQYRSTGATAGAAMGLVLDAPCEGITTDNEIQQLILQRSQIESKIADLEDTARQNNIPPGVFRTPAAFAQAVPILTPEETQSALIGRLQELDEDEVLIESVVQDMKDEAASRHMTLIPEAGFGGGVTADFLQQLATQESALREEASAVADDARHSGVPTGLLP
jgi:hypothetical protein